MNATITGNWYDRNQRFLSAALVTVRAALMQCAKPAESVFGLPPIPEESNNVPDNISTPSAIEALCIAFGLSHFERDVLLMCAGVELDSSFASLCSALHGDTQQTYPTFSLALAALADPHWSALMPNAPLRYWRLLEVGAGNTLTTSQLRIDERVLHFLTGLQHLDARLATVVEPLSATGNLVPSHAALVEEIIAVWTGARAVLTPTLQHLPAVQLCGNEMQGKRAIAAAACEALGLSLGMISAHAIPLHPDEFETFTRLWEREVILGGSALLLDCDELDSADSARERSISRLIESTRGAIIVSSRERRRALHRPLLTFEVRKPTPGEQRTLWRSALGSAALTLNGKVEALVSQFNLDTSSISAASAGALVQHTSEQEHSSLAKNNLAQVLWDACRMQARPHLDDLAQRIEPAASWEDLVLPELQQQIVRDIAAHVRQRGKVYETWGFASRGLRGLGINALFAGSSGTGKTMAAEVLANELRLDLYHIDLSQVVSKYIGETEKNLRRVFDAAEEGGAILLFDEADALFGKRSEVKDSHDRYANIEVSYLLQRMEAYRGLAILTTNMKSALDTAFLRRIRFIVQFPFPDAAQRMEIWRRIFPASTPTEGLDMTKLARLNVTGGNIRNIALNAAFLAAEAQEPVRMAHLLRAARSEYAKLEKSLTEAEIGGWI